MAKAKTRAANLPVPQDRDEAAALVTAIGTLQRQKARLEADMNDRLAAIKEEYEAKVAPLSEAISEKTEGVRIWADANRTRLTGGDKSKTVDLGTGVLRWRSLPPSVRLTRVDAVVERIQALGFKRFLRTKVEVDKEAMLKEPATARTIAGVAIGSAGEEFSVEPFEAELTGESAT